MAKKPLPIISTSKEIKSFNFEKEGTRLDFSLRVDTPDEIKNFLSLLEAAQVVVAKEFTIRFKK